MNKFVALGLATLVALLLIWLVSGYLGVVLLALAVGGFEYYSQQQADAGESPQPSNIQASPTPDVSHLSQMADTVAARLDECEDYLGNIYSTQTDAVDTLAESFVELQGLVEQ